MKAQYEHAWHLVTQSELDEKTGDHKAAQAKLQEAEHTLRVLLTEHERERGKDTPQYAAFLSDYGSVRSRQCAHGEALEILQAALDLKIALYGPVHAEVGTGYWELGLACERWNQAGRARDYFLEAVRVDSQVFGSDHKTVGDECHELGLVSLKLNKLSEALRWFMNAVEIRRKALGTASYDYQQSHHGVAKTLFDLGRYQECAQQLDELLEITRTSLGEQQPLFGFRLLLYGLTLVRLEQPEGAVTVKRAIELVEAVDTIPELSLMEARDTVLSARAQIRYFSLISPAERLIREGEYQQAEVQLKATLEILQPEEKAMTSQVLSRLVEVQRLLKKRDDALESAQQALELDRERFADDLSLACRNDLAGGLIDLGLVLSDRGRIIEADRLYLESEQLDEEILAAEPGAMFVYWRQLSRAGHRASLGKVREALEAGRSAFAQLDASVVGSERYAVALSDLAQLYQNVGEHHEAERLTRKALKVIYDLSGVDHPLAGRFSSNLAIILYEMFLHTEAAEHMEAASRAAGKVAADRERRRVGVLQLLASRRRDEDSFSHDLFLSYNTENEQEAAGVHAALEETGLDVWTFKELAGWERQRPNEVIVAEEQAQLVKSRAMLLIVTGTSLTSRWVLGELETAFAHDIEVMCWYPDGMQIRPREASTWATAEPRVLADVAGSLHDARVANLFGVRSKGHGLQDVAKSILFRVLSIYPGHPLHDKYQVKELRSAVRHMTQYDKPIFIGEDGTLLFPELQQL